MYACYFRQKMQVKIKNPIKNWVSYFMQANTGNGCSVLLHQTSQIIIGMIKL